MRRWAAIAVSVLWVGAVVVALWGADWFCGNPTEHHVATGGCPSDDGGALASTFVLVPLLVGALAGWRWAPLVFAAGAVAALTMFALPAGLVAGTLLLAFWLSVAAQRGR